MSVTYHELIAAGYRPEQIITCPYQPCRCLVSIAQGKGYARDCGLAQPAAAQEREHG